MLALSLTFPAGRYHATPWDRHVNEGAVAWPPEPWRILRALIATWHHKIKHNGHHDESTLLHLIESLTQELPQYGLPAASHSHTRHYMPQFSGKTSLVFDAFAAVRRDQPLAVVWPTVELPDDQVALLDELLAVVGHLGRAESWVEAERLDASPAVNCSPDTVDLDTETGELRGELVTMYAPLQPDQYQALRQQFLTDKKAVKKLGATLPENLLDALSIDTADLRKQGWSQPPAARKVSYLRPVDALRPRFTVPQIENPDASSASFILIGKPLPRVEDSLRIGELMRIATIGTAGRIFGKESVPALLSGHGLGAGNQHRHAFFLPWDSNGDGRLDRVLLHVPGGLGEKARDVIAQLRKLWSRDGGEWQLVLEAIGDATIAGPLAGTSNVWQSMTPYLHPWHRKKGFDAEQQLRRECRERGLPEPVATQQFDEIEIGGRGKRRPIHFQRFRQRRGLTQPDRHGSFWRLEFPVPIAGPLALGFACHYGLGLFRPLPQAEGAG